MWDSPGIADDPDLMILGWHRWRPQRCWILAVFEVKIGDQGNLGQGYSLGRGYVQYLYGRACTAILQTESRLLCQKVSYQNSLL